MAGSTYTSWLPNPSEMFQNAGAALSFATSQQGVEYGLTSQVLGTVAGMVEGAIAGTASGVVGPRVTMFMLGAFNKALDAGLQQAYAPKNPIGATRAYA